MIERDREFCHICRAVTEWTKKSRTSKFLRCAGCKDRFPCKLTTCGHLDCEAARAA